jgi:outer membrane lipoprotein-sorting protein
MMRVKLISLFITLFFINQLQAQVVDKKANDILNKLSAKMKTYINYKIEFVYTLENKTEKIKQSKNGTAIIKGDKYSLNVSGQRIISDGKTVWTYIPDADEVQINNVNPTDDDALNPSKLLSTYDKNYKAKLIKELNQGGVMTQIVDLVPIKGKNYFKVRLTIDKVKLQIISTEIYNKNGSTYMYKVSKFLSNLKIADSEFIFKASDFPGVEVNDMR